jgi:hypothetical protein
MHQSMPVSPSVLFLIAFQTQFSAHLSFVLSLLHAPPISSSLIWSPL